jgi:hypothetical protein
LERKFECNGAISKKSQYVFEVGFSFCCTGNWK